MSKEIDESLTSFLDDYYDKSFTKKINCKIIYKDFTLNAVFMHGVFRPHKISMNYFKLNEVTAILGVVK